MRSPDPHALISVLRTPAPTPVPPRGSAYWTFYRAVAAAQLEQWLPRTPARVLDLSGPGGFGADLSLAGHEVVLVRPDPSLVAVHADGERQGAGRVLPVVADSSR